MILGYRGVETFVFDLDGVIWIGGSLVAWKHIVGWIDEVTMDNS